MACYRPIVAWAPIDGSPLFFGKELKDAREVKLPCGKCTGCKEVQRRDWALRCMHEAQMHDEPSSFVTLTYNDENYEPSLNYEDFRRFMWRVRKTLGPTRFFMGAEYGSIDQRPHFHAILFGRSFPDRTPFGDSLYRSSMLEKMWRLGYSTVGDLTDASAAYVAKYACKKITDDDARESHYSRVHLRTGEIVQVEPEFGRMSLKPGIGYTWLEKYWHEVYIARDGVIMKGGKKIPAPKYYDKILKELNPTLWEEKQKERYENSAKFVEDCSPERLAAREICAIAKHQRRKERL